MEEKKRKKNTLILNNSLDNLTVVLVKKGIINYKKEVNHVNNNIKKNVEKMVKSNAEYKIDSKNLFSSLYKNYDNNIGFSGGGIDTQISSLINLILKDEGITEINTINQIINLINGVN